MSTKELLKHARSLQQKKFRDLHGEFLVQGPKVVGELLSSGWPVVEVLATAEQAGRMGLRQAVIVPAYELERVGTLETGNEVIAIARKPAPDGFEALGADELVLALDGIADPGNLGTVLRVADWFGIRRVLCSHGSVDAFIPKCVQSSMGGIFRVRVHYSDLVPLLAREAAAGVAVYAADMGGVSVFSERLQRPAVLVLGSESHGLSAEVRAVAGRVIAVPRNGGAESLNVAVAASALCMEFARQGGVAQ
ncbi:MAG: RNA methyltransferase [Flavobacteriales bacterium]|nr:RNA methyltransferase [Flavobacteriales bacterium]